MTLEIDDSLLSEFVLGLASDSEREAVEERIAVDATVAREVGALTDALATLATSLPAVEPPASARARLMGSLDHAGRFAQFVDRVARLVDVSAAQARRLLAGIDDLGTWVAGPTEGCTLYHLSGGPAVAQAVVGFVRMVPGTKFPMHRHLGDETAMVVQGAYREADGTVIDLGAVRHMAAGTEHDLTALPGPDLIFLAVVMEGVDIGGYVLRAGDPRF